MESQTIHSTNAYVFSEPTLDESFGAVIVTTLAIMTVTDTLTTDTQTRSNPDYHYSIIEPEEFGDLDIEQLNRVRIFSSTPIPSKTGMMPAMSTSFPVNYVSAAYGSTIYRQAGLKCHPLRNLNIRADIYIILRRIGRTLRNRLYYFRSSDYSSEAPSIRHTLRPAF